MAIASYTSLISSFSVENSESITTYLQHNYDTSNLKLFMLTGQGPVSININDAKIKVDKIKYNKKVVLKPTYWYVPFYYSWANKFEDLEVLTWR